MVKIKRESWKGKFYVVVREKGKIISRRRWSKDFMIKEANKIYNKNRSLKENVERTFLVNVVESVRYKQKGERLYIRKGLVQYFIEAYVGGQRVVARSLQHEYNYPRSKMRDEAFENFYSRVGEIVGDYDPETGLQYINDNNIEIREGVVYYASRTS